MRRLPSRTGEFETASRGLPAAAMLLNDELIRIGERACAWSIRLEETAPER
jgi:hypothetical protein